MLPLLVSLASPEVLAVRVRSRMVLNRFDPRSTLGACVDGGNEGQTARVLAPRAVPAMRSAGLGALAYRLRTELAGEAWHWNPQGRFSQGDRGYWTSDARAGRRIERSWGYRLPRRGDTFDQANDDGYSRLTDGDPGSFWKSSPYLGAKPQWVLVQLPKAQAIDAVRVQWAAPHALRLRAEYWDGANPAAIDAEPEGVWRAFPNGLVGARGGDEILRIGRATRVRWVRLRLLDPSPPARAPRDSRDARGFAIREIGIGVLRDGRFKDALVHRPDRQQSPTWVSSTDPWHRAVDRDPRTEQPGLDAVFRSGLANGRAVLLPAGVLYDTPENMAALLRWLRARRYPVRGFEMGEEPDGQICLPEDFAALYRRTAAALRAVDPEVGLGGPGLQTIETEFGGWALRSVGQRDVGPSWAARLVKALRARLGFVSFEWYPFDDVSADPAGQLARARPLLERSLARIGTPPSLPRLMTEYGYSAFSGPAEVDLPGSLLNLDIVATFLAHGGRAAFLYGLAPAKLAQERPGVWGELAMFLPDGTRLPTYWAARLLTRDWCGVESGDRALLATDSSDPLLGAYALRRPDGPVSVLLLNKDPRRSRSVRLDLDGRSVAWGNLTQYGPAQYVWHADGPRGRPVRNLPPTHSSFEGTILLPRYSATVATFR